MPVERLKALCYAGRAIKTKPVERFSTGRAFQSFTIFKEIMTIGNCELYLGDCLEILPEIGSFDTVVTDPVWPNNSLPEFDHIDTYKLFDDAWNLIDTKRAAIQLGCDSDPSILYPIAIPFFRVVWLEYTLPGHKGRLLNTGDVGYLYGPPPAPLPGKKLVSGKCVSTSNFGKESDHPCPMKLQHVKWLVNQCKPIHRPG